MIKKKERCGYGINLEYQNSILNQMTELVKKLKTGKKRTTLPFQKGIILSNSSLQQLLPYLQEKYGHVGEISYILTRKLNQDVLENFFSYIRAMGGPYDKPSALQFQYRLKRFILGRHGTDMLIEKCNVEEDEDQNLVDASTTISCCSAEIQAMDDVMGPLYDNEINICHSFQNDPDCTINEEEQTLGKN